MLGGSVSRGLADAYSDRGIGGSGGRRAERRALARWLRQARATHALEHGHAPMHPVQATLGHAPAATTSKDHRARPDDSSALHLGP
jgi:hypothetical protein